MSITISNTDAVIVIVLLLLY